MKSWRGQLSFVGFATVAFALLVHGCQSPEAFHLGDDAALSDSGGRDDSGSGGSTGTGGKGSGGADGTGGQGSGGISGTGGLASGGATPAGLAGRNGTAGHGGRSGSGGAGGRTTTGTAGHVGSGGAGGRGGRSGAGGRSGVGLPDGNCINDIQANGYSAGTAPPCSACKDNGKSLQTECEAVIDCVAPQWPCSGNCLTQCYNMAGASGPVMACVSALTMAACGM